MPWDRVVDLNLKAALFAAQAAAGAMTRGGAIVNVSSHSASYPNPGTGRYGAAKAALENLSRTASSHPANICRFYKGSGWSRRGLPLSLPLGLPLEVRKEERASPL